MCINGLCVTGMIFICCTSFSCWTSDLYCRNHEQHLRGLRKTLLQVTKHLETLIPVSHTVKPGVSQVVISTDSRLHSLVSDHSLLPNNIKPIRYSAACNRECSTRCQCGATLHAYTPPPPPPPPSMSRSACTM